MAPLAPRRPPPAPWAAPARWEGCGRRPRRRAGTERLPPSRRTRDHKRLRSIERRPVDSPSEGGARAVRRSAAAPSPPLGRGGHGTPSRGTGPRCILPSLPGCGGTARSPPGEGGAAWERPSEAAIERPSPPAGEASREKRRATSAGEGRARPRSCNKRWRRGTDGAGRGRQASQGRRRPRQSDPAASPPIAPPTKGSAGRLSAAASSAATHAAAGCCPRRVRGPRPLSNHGGCGGALMALGRTQTAPLSVVPRRDRTTPAGGCVLTSSAEQHRRTDVSLLPSTPWMDPALPRIHFRPSAAAATFLPQISALTIARLFARSSKPRRRTQAGHPASDWSAPPTSCSMPKREREGFVYEPGEALPRDVNRVIIPGSVGVVPEVWCNEEVVDPNTLLLATSFKNIEPHLSWIADQRHAHG